MKHRLTWVLGLGLAVVMGMAACGDDSKPAATDASSDSAGLGGSGGDASSATDALGIDAPTGTDGGTIDAPGSVDAAPGDDGSAQPSAATIGPAGGSVTSADGRLILVIPRGALIRPADVEITVVGTPPVGALGTVYEITPVQEPLSKPALLSFKYSTADVGTGRPADLRLGRWAGEQWADLAHPTPDLTKLLITAELPALGTVALLSGVCQVCPAACVSATCKFGGDMGVAGKCLAFGHGCSKCVPTCDGDGDGYCPGTPGNDQPGNDCQDGDPNVSPGAVELCNGIDDNCDGHVDEGCKACASDTDCTVGREACLDGTCKVCDMNCTAENCNFGGDQPGGPIAGKCVAFGKGCNVCVPSCDMDGDGFCPGTPTLNQPGGDCNDTNPKIKPGTAEICGNGVDDDCNGFIDDGCTACGDDAACQRDLQACVNGACQGCLNACNPMTCRFSNGVGDPGVAGKCVTFGKGCSRCVPDCDGDGDGYCPGNADHGQQGGDCKDNDPNAHPGAIEICGNGVDDDCDSLIDEGCDVCATDADCKQGFEACIGGVCDSCGNCDANNCRFGATDVPGSGVAGTCKDFGNGCSKCIPSCDKDGDGYCPGDMVNGQPGGDCNDAVATAHPGAIEICGNKIDDNCDGRIDEACATCGAATACGTSESCSTGR